MPISGHGAALLLVRGHRHANKKAAGPLAHRPCVVFGIARLIFTFPLNESSFMAAMGSGKGGCATKSIRRHHQPSLGGTGRTVLNNKGLPAKPGPSCGSLRVHRRPPHPLLPHRQPRPQHILPRPRRCPQPQALFHRL